MNGRAERWRGVESLNKVCAVVVTYNRLNDLQQCVDALRNQTLACDILIINNSSTDGTGEWLSAMAGTGLEAVSLRENSGGAGGFNKGIRKAAENGYDYVWVMDDDCLPEKDALSRMMEADRELKGSYGWLSSFCLWTDHTPCRMNVQRVTPYQDLKFDDRNLQPVQMASFVSLLIPAQSVRRFGLPIADFFIWGDDWEYTRRISREMPCYFVKDSRVIHAMKSNTVVSIDEDDENRLPRYRYSYRNDVYLYRREGLMGWIWLFGKNIWHSLKSIRRGHPDRLRVIWGGFRAGLSFSPVIEFLGAGNENT